MSRCGANGTLLIHRGIEREAFLIDNWCFLVSGAKVGASIMGYPRPSTSTPSGPRWTGKWRKISTEVSFMSHLYRPCGGKKSERVRVRDLSEPVSDVKVNGTADT